LRIEWTAGGQVLVTCEGHGDALYAKRITERLQSMGGNLVIFFDGWLLVDYDSDLRIELTNWLIKNRDRLAELHAVYQSRLVAVAIEVANVALGGLIKIHPSRSTFDQEVAAANLAVAAP